MSCKRALNYANKLLFGLNQGLNMAVMDTALKNKENGNIDWMGNLPDNVRSLPISRLTIPGSHNSFTYSLVRGGKAGPDQPKCIQKVAAMFPSIASRILIRWGICQHKTATYQLENGIRYFDIRLVAVEEPESQPKGDKFEDGSEKEREHRILHCLIGSQIKPILSEIKLFLASHLGEVVILDLQHLYDFQAEDHTFLMKTLLDMFEGQLCPWQLDLDAITLDAMRRAGQQVIVIYPALYRSQETRDQLLGALDEYESSKYPPSELFWPRNLCPTPWPNTTNGDKMEEFLDNKLNARDPRFLFVSQGIFTPNLGTIVFHPFSTLETACAKRCNKRILKWLQKQKDHLHKPNIVITDFLFDDDCACNIVDQIIGMNNIVTGT